MSRRAALMKRITELRAELNGAWALALSVKRIRALTSYIESALKELRELDRAERAAHEEHQALSPIDPRCPVCVGSGPDQGPAMPPRGDR